MPVLIAVVGVWTYCHRHHVTVAAHLHSHLSWYLGAGVAVLLIVRGRVLGRPLTIIHTAVVLIVLSLALTLHFVGLSASAAVLVAISGAILTWPSRSHPDPGVLAQVWVLVQRTAGDPLAPFAMHSGKAHCFNVDHSAVIAYRALLGFAVVSGDPIGDRTGFDALTDDFIVMCRKRGWRILVLACSDASLALWRTRLGSPDLLSVRFGRDVVIDADRFTMAGRRFRNLRQAVQRTHNSAMTTQIVDEAALRPELVAELAAVLGVSQHRSLMQRGFAMNLDGALEGRYPGVSLIIARDRAGKIQGFHRYARAGGNDMLTLDAPYRRRGAPNGIDERLSVDMIAEARLQGVQKVSLAFAPFPDLFDSIRDHQKAGLRYGAAHLLDPLIRLESQYRYMRKFHAMGGDRYVLLKARHAPIALIALLWLEFAPRRRYLESTAVAGRSPCLE